MNRDSGDKKDSRLFRFVLLFLPILVLLSSASALVCAPESGAPDAGPQKLGDELVANLAAGRVLIYVAKDGMAIGAVQNQIEPESKPPVVLPLSRRRAAILLGAVEWLQPGSSAPPARMDRELLRVAGESAGAKRLQQEHAEDIEALGLRMLGSLRKMTEKLHNKLDLGPEEPLVELLLVGYVEDYGPEVWSLRYRIVQEPLRGDYWHTRILRPRYTQLYPPRKGQPHTLIEVRYPEDSRSTLLEQWNQQLKTAPLRTRDPQLVRATDLLTQGQSNKAKLDDAVTWLRAVLNAIPPPGSAQALAVIAEESGFDWVLAPREAPARAEEAAPREPGAPTLRKKP